jgi:hypothetical protein
VYAEQWAGHLMTEEIRVGRHVLRFEEGEFMDLHVRGSFLPGELGTLTREFEARLVKKGRMFVFCRVSEHGLPSPASRQEIKHRSMKIPPHWIAFVGQSRELNVILDLILRARALLTRSIITHRYFQDEPSARAWLVDMHAKCLSSG